MIYVLEFYSGIGGMHFALKKSDIAHKVIAAIDVNDCANGVYRENFVDTLCINGVIEALNEEDLRTRYKADLWTMSPPCQPFSRLGKQKDVGDQRTNSFLHILKMIPRILPRYILLENVKGFDGSEACTRLLSTLKECGYYYQQFLLSPLQFGVPNSRLRYYLIASRCKLSNQCNSSLDCVQRVPPMSYSPMANCNCIVCRKIDLGVREPSAHFDEYHDYLDPLSEYLLSDDCSEVSNSYHLSQLVLPESMLLKGFKVLDLVTRDSVKTMCFTKSYGKMLDGAGSYLQTSNGNTMSKESLDKLKDENCDQDTLMQYAKSLSIRYFHPKEIANLMCFPPSFKFPESASTKQQYKLLGNSVNILVVAHLIHWLINSS